MTRYLLDTNHASALLRGNTAFREKIERAPDDRFFLCSPSIGELYFMVFNSTRISENRARLEGLVGGFDVVPFDMLASVEFGRILTDATASGTTYSLYRCADCGNRSRAGPRPSDF